MACPRSESFLPDGEMLNRRRREPVLSPARWSGFGAVVVAVFAGVSGAGCVDVNGGAVELSWDVRDMEGNSSTCEALELETVQLRCQALDSEESCTSNNRFPLWE